MTLQLIEYELGPLANRTLLLYNEESKQSVVVDPAFGCDSVIADIRRLGLQLERILVTHAHFDHIGGAAQISRSGRPDVPAYFHPDDITLWQTGGGAGAFGFHIDLDIPYQADLGDRQHIPIGTDEIIVHHTPGHTRGHVVFEIPSLRSVLVGDLIFYLGVGRTDLPGGDARTLIHSIKQVILTLDDDYRLYPGHGPTTTVGFERENNPFL